MADGRELGTLPIENILSPGMMLIFSGRRWLVQEVHDREKVIVVKPAKAGVPPVFGGAPGDIHDKVIERMFEVLEGDAKPRYMDWSALGMLEEARLNFERMGFRDSSLITLGERAAIVATRAGTVKTATLAIALRTLGFSVEQHDGFLYVESGYEAPPLTAALERLGAGENFDLCSDVGNLMSEKFHPYLSKDLLALDARTSRLAPLALADLARQLM